MINYSALSIKKLMRQAVRDLRTSELDSAVDITTEIIERQDDHPGAHAVQFSALFKSKRFEEARRMGTAAAELNPKSVFILNNQACLQLEAKQPAAASGLLKSLIEQYGERGQWLYNLALAQRMVGNFDYAITTFSRTLDFDQEHDRAAFQLADCLTLVGSHEQAARAFDYVRLLRSKHAPSHSNYLHHAVVNNALSQEDLDLEMALWRDRFIPSDKRYDVRENDGDLKVGFLIGKLPATWGSLLIAPVINGLSEGGDDVSVYWHDERSSTDLFSDGVTLVPSAKYTDADFARKVRADGIDIMIDVCGMRIGSRQRPLGLQVAGKQLGWLAHEGQYATPLVSVLDNTLKHYCADLSQIESTQDIPENTFSAMGCHRGVSEEVLNVWAAIMLRLPNWNLHLPSLNQLANKKIVRRFDSMGVNASRLFFDTSIKLNHKTIALDNFVENNPVSTIIALQQGATIVSRRGDLFPAQHTERILNQCGRQEWLVNTNSEYQQRAIELAESSNRSGLSSAGFEESGLANMAEFVKRFRESITDTD